MLSIFGVFLAFSGLFIGWVIGANDAGNSMGTAVGAGVRSERAAMILVSVFGLLGAVLMGGKVARTLGEGVIPLPDLPVLAGQLIGLSAMVGAGVTILICTLSSIPVSTSHAIVGGIVGGGISAGLKSQINWSETIHILMAWMLTPVGSFVVSYGIIKVCGLISESSLLQTIKKRFHLGAVVKGVLILTGCYMAFSWGANDVANATGIVASVLKISPRVVSFLGGLAMCGGVILLGKRVMVTIGQRITRLTPFMALVAEFSAALTVNLFTLVGMPVSTTHAIVGAVGGVGWAKARARKRSRGELEINQGLNTSLLLEITFTWFLTPILTGAFAFFFLRLFRVLYKVFLQLCH